MRKVWVLAQAQAVELRIHAFVVDRLRLNSDAGRGNHDVTSATGGATVSVIK